MHDALDAQAGHNILTDLLSEDKGGALRIDHLWVNARVEVIKAHILHLPRAHRARDHYPLYADLLVR